LESRKDAFSIELQQYCITQPVCVIRGLAGALKLGLLHVLVLLLSIFVLSIFSARQHAERAICYRNSVCLSVCPSLRLSVTRVDQSKTVERIIEILSRPDRPNILVFRHQRSLRKSDGFTPNGGAKYKGGSKN